MKINLYDTVSLGELIKLAKDLRADAEDGENPEYDRALLELITDAARIPQNDRTIIADLIGTSDFIHGTPTKG